MKNSILYIVIVIIAAVFAACEKEIDIDLPDAEAKLVVDGRIEQGLPPIIILTKSVGYFEPTDINTLNNLFVHDADIQVNNGSLNESLIEICSADVPDSLLPLVTQLTGLSESDLSNINFCVYTSLNSSIWGEIGKTYDLTINSGEHTLTSSTTINDPIPLDSLWYMVFGDRDTLGFILATLSDPGGVTNYYRWEAQRINEGANGAPKDFTFVPPSNSVFDDQFFDGLTFDFAYDRGSTPNSSADDDNNAESGFFKTGDTVIVKFSTIDREVEAFLRQMETQQFTNGNPFAAPTSVPTNIEGGLGVWAGYGVSLDTVVCIE